MMIKARITTKWIFRVKLLTLANQAVKKYNLFKATAIFMQTPDRDRWMYLSRSKLSIANPCNVTIRITRSCDTVLWLINQNRMKPQSPVEDLCIFSQTRLSSAWQLFPLAMCFAMCHVVTFTRGRRSAADSKVNEWQCPAAAFHISAAECHSKLGTLFPSMHYAWYGTQTVRKDFSLLQWLINNS